MASRQFTHSSIAGNTWGAAPTPVSPPSPWGLGVVTLSKEPHERGLGMGFENLRLTTIQPGTPADRAGMREMLGRRVTHINDHPVTDNHDINSLSAGPHSRFRFSPLEREHSPPSEHTLAAIDKLREEASIVVLNRRHRTVPLGIDLREPGLTLEIIDALSPASEAGMQQLIGHQLTHVNGRFVTNITDVMLASEGLLSVEMRFKPHFCGVTVRRSSPNTPWGFSVDSATLDLLEVYPGSPGHKSGLKEWMSHKVTHVNGVHIKSSHQLVEAMGAPVKELQIRMTPWSGEEAEDVPDGGARQEEVRVDLPREGGLGMGLSNTDMILEQVQPGSAADQAALLPSFKGWQLTHVDGAPVSCIEDIANITRTATADHAWFRFEEVNATNVLSPDTLANDNINVQKYRQWLKRRSSDRDRANAPPTAPQIRSRPYYTSPHYLASTSH